MKNIIFVVLLSVLWFVMGFLRGNYVAEKYYDPIIKEAIGWEYGETNLTYTCQHFCESEFEKFGC